MNRYLIITAIYRFVCGGLILLINWELANPKSAIDLAVSIVLSFVPAIFTPFIVNSVLKKLSGSLLSKYSFLAIVFLVIITSFVYANSKLLILCNFILWIIFFLLETSFELWFSELVESQSEDFINKYSSLSMTVNQVALMVGPLFITFIVKYINLKKIFIIYSLLYLLLFFCTKGLKSLQVELEKTDIEVEPIKLSHYFISMLMWPILGTINFMLPIYTTYQKGGMYEVAFLDSALGIGMALVGVILSKYLSQTYNRVFMYISFILPFVWFIFEDSFFIRLILMLLFGISFGGARIIFRKIVVMRYSSASIKKIYSLGNALGLSILALSIYIGTLNISTVWIPSFLLLIVLLILLNIQYKKVI
ncbi:hypothetical protein JWK42_07900 [Staphylococcus epidermidis]|uniref:hypothetical protein n=1 Tax=Staphylococcus epidermidis TaxID=1282 RepID=UPI0002433218|nr:hypothetical protein [Staphylococcus epidermidis]EHM66191.1 putative membrane protein [Staphylococcus epidermidis VCU071]MBM0779536.1 hypothetical protein [Staphylococcus epidermidis]MBO0389702.1 hypothetical protein [Staphylococcus epidermidis]MCG2137144.1 hypothetical protein [Staphylococcus epidermidis]MCO6207471.1 hypothetical protein [Staphylococcus epidermidis]